jgi:hypothetical protein
MAKIIIAATGSELDEQNYTLAFEANQELLNVVEAGLAETAKIKCAKVSFYCYVFEGYEQTPDCQEYNLADTETLVITPDNQEKVAAALAELAEFRMDVQYLTVFSDGDMRFEGIGKYCNTLVTTQMFTLGDMKSWVGGASCQ